MKKNSGFSLIELLVSLIIISLILSALAPIMTKKLKYKEITLLQDAKSESSCIGFDTQGRCIMCDQKNCTLCTTQIESKEGYYVNPSESCDYQECAILDTNCKNCTKDGCIECIDGYKINIEGICEKIVCGKGEYVLKTKCAPCEKGSYQELESHSEQSCKPCPNNCSECNNRGECSLVLQTPSSSADCPGAFYYQGMCITTRNAGDEGGPSINFEEIKITSSGTKCTGGYCCWQGRTAGTCASNTGSTYSPCNRTACQASAAKIICENYSTSYAPTWTLPTRNDVTVIRNASASVAGIQGANFCIASKSTGYDYCASATGNKYCIGATGSDATAETNFDKCFTHEYIVTTSATASLAASVRCVAKQVYK